MQSRNVTQPWIGRHGLARFAAIFVLLITTGIALCQTQTEPYKLGAEDVITVTVQRHLEYSGDLLIPADGVVDLPLQGPTKVAGMTLTEVKNLLLKALSVRFVNPEVNVTLRQARTRRVYIEGNVKAATTLDWKPGWRIRQVLAGAGGLPDTVQAIDCKVVLLHQSTGKTNEVSLPDVLNGNPKANLAVEPGDVVTITTLESIPVFVVGQVKTPGQIRMRVDGVSFLTALSLAGGLLPTASTAGVTLTHANGQVEKLDITDAILNGTKTKLPNLRTNDLINVPELQARFAMTGLVKNPGLFPLADGKQYRLSDGIALAGGNDPHRSRMSRVAILRNDHGKMTRLVIDYGLFLRKGDLSKNILLQNGDVIFVPETNSIDWQAIFNGLVSTYYLINATHTL